MVAHCNLISFIVVSEILCFVLAGVQRRKVEPWCQYD